MSREQKLFYTKIYLFISGIVLVACGIWLFKVSLDIDRLKANGELIVIAAFAIVAYIIVTLRIAKWYQKELVSKQTEEEL